MTEEPYESHESATETSSHESHHEQVVEPEVEEEPATEIDPITGIYRLKPKAKPEDEHQSGTEHSYRDSHASEHSNGSEDSAFQSAFTTNSVNYEKPFESSSFGQETEQGGHESESKEGDYTQLTLTVPASDETHYDQDNSENKDQ